MKFRKRRVKTSTRNDFIYGELGQTGFYTRPLNIIIEVDLKLFINSKYIKRTYSWMLKDIN